MYNTIRRYFHQTFIVGSALSKPVVEPAVAMSIRHESLLATLASLVIAGAFAAGPAAARAAVSNAAYVVTRSGPMQGRVGNGYRAFLGIPYAEPPVGELRWAAPVPIKPWKVTLNATALRHRCLQLSWGVPKQVEGSEDCLYLNVYTPLPKGGAPLNRIPVLVWIHGGHWIAGGSQDVDPSYMASREGIIVVTPNYRLGALGFFASPALDAQDPHHTSGNEAIRDQQVALRWIHNNIAAFGGDPERVTVSGQSAGSMSAWTHLVSPGSQGLFQQIIGESGPARLKTYNDRTPSPNEPFSAGTSLKVEEQQGASSKLFQALGCANAPNPLECARSKSGKDLLTAFPNLRDAGWGEVADGVVVPGNVATLILEGHYNKRIRIMTGFTATEAGFFDFIMPQGNGRAPLTATEYEQQISAMPNGEKILARYPASAYDSPDDAFIAEASDGGHCSMIYTAKALAALSPVYMYEFDDMYPPPTLFTLPVPPNIHPGAYHTADIAYVFQRGYPNEIRPGVPPFSTPQQKALSDRIMGYWASFVKTGNPTSNGVWTHPSGSRTIFIESPSGDHMAADGRFEADNHCAFWRSL